MIEIQDKQLTDNELFYPVTPTEWIYLCSLLRPAELKVLIFIRTIDPQGWRWHQLEISALADTLNLHKGTVSKALKRLEALNLIEMDLQSVNVRIKSPDEVLPTNNELPTDPNRCLESSAVACRQHLSKSLNGKPARGKGFRNGDCTNCFKRSKKETTGTCTPDPGKEQGAIGTPALIQTVQKSGIEPNRTIAKQIFKIEQSDGPAAAAAAVRNALSAVLEQMAGGKVRNPQGLLVAALRRNFTANEAKREGREAPPPPPAAPAAPPAAAPAAPPPPDATAIEMAIDQALIVGDRTFAASKLMCLWANGHSELVRELLQLRSEWQFKLDANGVRDRL